MRGGANLRNRLDIDQRLHRRVEQVRDLLRRSGEDGLRQLRSAGNELGFYVAYSKDLHIGFGAAQLATKSLYPENNLQSVR